MFTSRAKRGVAALSGFALTAQVVAVAGLIDLLLGANAKGEVLSVDFPFAVLAATAESLPVTGLDSAKLAMAAALLILMGIVFVALPGRRRREED